MRTETDISKKTINLRFSEGVYIFKNLLSAFFFFHTIQNTSTCSHHHDDLHDRCHHVHLIHLTFMVMRTLR